jgi:hypothetical protein
VTGPAARGGSATPPPVTAGTGGSRRLVLLLLAAAVLVTLLTAVVARSRRLQRMRADLAEVLTACQARYAAAATAADTAAADVWQPPLHGAERPHDPPCGPYRRRNMLGPAPR